MGWLSDIIGKVHAATKYLDPVDHYIMDATHQFSTKLVNETSRLIERVGGTSVFGKAGTIGKNLSERDKGDFNGWLTRTGTSAAAYFGGTAASEAFGGAGSGVESVGSQGLGGVGQTAGSGGLAGSSGVGAGAYETGSVAASGASEAGTGTGAAKEAGKGSAWKDAAKQVGVGAATNLVSKLGQKKPDEPTVQTPVEMPDPAAQALARRRKLAEQLARRGRVSTIMTNGG